MVSPRQSYRVMSSLIEDDMIESTNEYGILLTLVSRCVDSLRRIGDIENTESNRVAAEELRKENEEERIRAEIERKEEFKKYNEVLFDKTNVNQLAGGYHQVKTLEDRDSIPIYKKAIGMLCYVESEDTIYQYKIEKGLFDWVEFRVGGGGSLFETLAERDSIPESKLFVGYSCFVLETMAEYYYSGDGVWNKTSTNSVHIGSEQPNDTSVLWIDDEEENVDTSLDSDIITEIKDTIKKISDKTDEVHYALTRELDPGYFNGVLPGESDSEEEVINDDEEYVPDLDNGAKGTVERILLKRGLKNEIENLHEGELGFCIDTVELYVGNKGALKLLAKVGGVGGNSKNINVTSEYIELIAPDYTKY